MSTRVRNTFMRPHEGNTNIDGLFFGVYGECSKVLFVDRLHIVINVMDSHERPSAVWRLVLCCRFGVCPEPLIYRLAHRQKKSPVATGMQQGFTGYTLVSPI